MANDEEKGAQVAAAPPKNKMLKFIMIPVIIAIQAAAAYYVVFNLLLEVPKKQAQNASKENRAPGKFYKMTDLVVNPASSNGRRFLVLELGFEARAAAAVEEAESKEIWMRDAVISLLMNKTEAELLDVAKREDLKTSILEAINRRLGKHKFYKIYLTKFIMQ